MSDWHECTCHCPICGEECVHIEAHLYSRHKVFTRMSRKHCDRWRCVCGQQFTLRESFIEHVEADWEDHIIMCEMGAYNVERFED